MRDHSSISSRTPSPITSTITAVCKISTILLVASLATGCGHVENRHTVEPEQPAWSDEDIGRKKVIRGIVESYAVHFEKGPYAILRLTNSDRRIQAFFEGDKPLTDLFLPNQTVELEGEVFRPKWMDLALKDCAVHEVNGKGPVKLKASQFKSNKQFVNRSHPSLYGILTGKIQKVESVDGGWFLVFEGNPNFNVYVTDYLKEQAPSFEVGQECSVLGTLIGPTTPKSESFHGKTILHDCLLIGN